MSAPIQVTSPSLPPLEEFIEIIKPIWNSHILTNSGLLHEQLKEKLVTYLKNPNISLYVNGHQALEAAIHSFKFPEGGEIITTPYTFISTTHAISRNRLTPVFCDISPVDFNIDIEQIEGMITDKTVAIVPVHIYGTPCDVEKIEKIARKYNLKVIYDAAHAFGVEVNGMPITSYGDASMLSFHATKVFNTIEGGAVVSPYKEITDTLNEYRRFGFKSGNPEDYVELGTNAKMHEISAAMGILNLKYIEQSIKHRKKVAEIYDAAFCNKTGLRILPKPAYTKANYAYYPVVVDESFEKTRDELFDELATNGINTRKYFYPIVTDFSCYKKQYDSKETPIARWVGDHVLTLPMYDTLDFTNAQRIADIICGN